MFGGGAIILSVLLKDQLKNYFFIGIIFSIFIICLSLIVDLTISDLSQKKDYLKMKDTNYLLVESMGQKDYYKEYDFGNKTFKDNFLFVPSNAEVELEGVRID